MPLSAFEVDATCIQLDVPGSRLGQPGPCNKISKWWYPVSAYFPAARFTSGHIFLLPILLRPDCWCTLSLLWHWAGCCVEEFYKIWSTSSRRRTLGSLDFPLDLMIGGINTSRKRCQGKRTTFAKLKYCWSNSFSYYNNMLFSIEISSALFKRLVKSDQWIRCLKPEFDCNILGAAVTMSIDHIHKSFELSFHHAMSKDRAFISFSLISSAKRFLVPLSPNFQDG